MKRSFVFLFLAIFAAAHADAAGYTMAPPKQSNPPSTSGSNQPAASNTAYAGPPKVQVSIMQEEKGASATTFPSNVQKLYASFKTQGTKKGDKVRGVWISTAKSKKLYETTLTGDQANFVGSFSINGPAQGWPPGNYKAEVYLNNHLAASANFTIKAKSG
jgi:hypothetical protein